MADDAVPVVELSDAGENWMVAVREQRLRARGWRGSAAEYMALKRELGGDPLQQVPPIHEWPAGRPPPTT